LDRRKTLKLHGSSPDVILMAYQLLSSDTSDNMNVPHTRNRFTTRTDWHTCFGFVQFTTAASRKDYSEKMNF
jgi:hypothetical protein